MTKVTIQRDICVNLIVPLTAAHDFIPLPPFPPVPPPLPGIPWSLAACALESPVNAWWPPGGALGSHKFTSTVFHQGMQICLDGHDCGKFIPHLQIMPAPNNMMTFIQIPFSARSANFSSSSVLMDGSATAGMTMIAWPPTPMTYCADPISLPAADAPTSHLNTVEIHISLGDWLVGAFAIGVGMLIDWAMFKKGGGTKDFGQGAGRMIARNRAGESVSSLLRREFISKLTSGPDMGWAMHSALGLATGAVQIARTGEGDLSIDSPYGGGFFSAGASASKGEDGWSGSASGSALTVDGSAGTEGVSATSRNVDGTGQTSKSHEWGGDTTSSSTSTDPFGGFQNEATTTGPDGTTVSRSDAPSTLPNQL